MSFTVPAFVNIRHDRGEVLIRIDLIAFHKAAHQFDHSLQPRPSYRLANFDIMLMNFN